MQMQHFTETLLMENHLATEIGHVTTTIHGARCLPANKPTSFSGPEVVPQHRDSRTLP